MQRLKFRHEREPLTWIDRTMNVLVWPVGMAIWLVLLWQPLLGLATLLGWR